MLPLFLLDSMKIIYLGCIMILLNLDLLVETCPLPSPETYPLPSLEEEGKFKCSKCDYTTDTEFYLTDHMQGGLKV